MGRSAGSESRVIAHLRALVAAADPGARIPPVRRLMEELKVSPVTIQNAMATLTREGLLEARPGSGTFVLAPPREVMAAGDINWQSLALGPGRAIGTESLDDFGTVPNAKDIVLNAGYPPTELQPIRELVKATGRAARHPDVWGRLPIEGLPELRAWFARDTGRIFEPHEVLICPGTQAALCAAFRALAAPGSAILMESPTYAGAIAAAQMVGLKIVPVPTDANGVIPVFLDEAFAKTGARLIYAQPCHSNPTGAVLAESRRRDVLDILRRRGAFLIEDDWARDFHLDSSPTPAPLAQRDDSGHIIYVRSLTKSSAPGLRVGAICARGAAFARLRQARLVDDFFVPGILQYSTLELVTASSWPGHLRSVRGALRMRRDALASAVRRYLGPESLPSIPKGGLHLWVELPASVSDRVVTNQSAQRSVLVSPGHIWFPGEPLGNYLRLSFASAPPQVGEEGARRIGEVVDSLR